VIVVQPVASDLETCGSHMLTPVLDDARLIAAWQAMAAGRPYHVHVDTGMNRGGIWWEGAAATLAPFLDDEACEGICTHFHSAETDAASVREQWGRFQTVLEALPRRPPIVHAANSAAALGHAETAADVVRPGIFLYGGRAAGLVPEPVVRWQAAIVRARWIGTGETVSYGATWQAGHPGLLVTVAAGYADGVRRSMAGRGAVLIGGRRAPFVGAVTMDAVMAVVPGVDEGWAEHELPLAATLIGGEDADTITLDYAAAAAGTISYEMLTGLGPRVERRYHE